MLLAVLAGALLAWFGYRGRLVEPLARWAAFARWVAATALVLLVLDPGFVARMTRGRPVVLLDRSLSMLASGGKASEAEALSASLGDTLSFGELAPGLGGGKSQLADLLVRSVAGGRRVVVVTDGEITDTALIPSDALGQVEVRTLPRAQGADVALTSALAPEHLAAGDTLAIALELWRSADAPDSVVVEVRDSARVLGSKPIQFSGAERVRQQLMIRLPTELTGERWLTIALRDNSDSEPGDDVRWLHLLITPTPGIVVIASPPDWEGRTLYRTLKDVANAPVAGYDMLLPGQWFRMSDLQEVSRATVLAAARSAAFLVVRGDVQPWQTLGKARLLWPSLTDDGDWFLSAHLGTPMGGAFVGVSTDSLPVLTGARAIPVDQSRGWIAATVKRSRRGVDVPVIGGTDGPSGRTIYVGAEGFFGWANQGGMSEQVWRGLVASATAYALGASEADSARARPTATISQRGRAVRFRWTGTGTPRTEAIEFRSDTGAIVTDSLRFDGSGYAAIALGTGRYQYRLGNGGGGTVAVEPYSDEFRPHPVTLPSRAAAAATGELRQSWRSIWWLFAVAVVGFGVEWLFRRRMGAP